MRPTLALLATVATLPLWGAACERTSGPAPRNEDPERESVRLFWATIRAATDSRLAGNCGEAAAHYERALSIDGRHEDALYYLGQCRRELGQPEQARSAFLRLVEVCPASSRGHLAAAGLLASPNPAEPMDLAAAERHLLRAHEINGEETGPIVRLGELEILLQRPREARRWFAAALRSNPRSVEAAFLDGFVAWTGGAASSAHFQRIRVALRVEVPVMGVLNEGDRKVDTGVAAPPLSNPLGRLLFEAPISALQRAAAAGRDLDETLVVGQWRETERLRRELARRAHAGRPAKRRVN